MPGSELVTRFPPGKVEACRKWGWTQSFSDGCRSILRPVHDDHQRGANASVEPGPPVLLLDQPNEASLFGSLSICVAIWQTQWTFVK